VASRPSLLQRFARSVAHVRALWGAGWLLPLIPAFYVVGVAAIGDLRVEHVAFALFAAGFGFIGPRGKLFLIDTSPIIAVAMGYDLVRYVRPFAVLPERVLGCELRQLDSALLPTFGGRTLQESLAALHTPTLDLIAAVPYTIFIYLVFVYATVLFFKDRPRMRHYLLAFAVGNYISFACWLLLPAAPPWYVHAHGCAIDTAVAANPAGLTRVDELFGISYYASFYSRASAVFGAMPSMHCAYPLIGLLSAWRVSKLPARLVHLGYVAIMSLAAMYLDHHWAVDVVAGWFTAVTSVVIARAWLNYRGRLTEQSRVPVESRPRPSRPSSPRQFERPTPGFR
jgi:membrane-associated phospholipid phosphatase